MSKHGEATSLSSYAVCGSTGALVVPLDGGMTPFRFPRARRRGGEVEATTSYCIDWLSFVDLAPPLFRFSPQEKKHDACSHR